ncbi:MAG: heat-inducible transcription repressor HrcA [candidate division Zixibacteria bacterium]|nr:heat-inducible transcription repressor HrcA [candidate division Zixibacteria bacterium]
MSFENLNDREKDILKALIDHYINTAEPVGSRTLSKQYDFGLSAASIRNTLKDLEEMGYISQPHTSAGRMPTNLGYRSYVDYLLTPENLNESEKKFIRHKMKTEFTAVGQILEQTSRVLSNLSQQLGVTITPQLDSAILTKLELIPVAANRLMVVLVVKSGLVKSILIEVESNLPDLAINETVEVLNERLCGLTLEEIKATIGERVKGANAGDPKLIKLFVEGPEEIWEFPSDEKLHFGGASKLLQQPEFRNPQDMTKMVELIEDRKAIHKMLTRTGISEGIAITIGHKNKKGEDEQLSMLSSSYDMGGIKGVVGIIGPTRMQYSKLVSLVDYTSKMLSEILSD